MFAVIGGSGLAKLAELTAKQRRVVRTPYGDASGALTFGRLDGTQVCFLARHGYGHTIAPHEINYRANLWALKEAGVSKILAVASVGGIRPDLAPGSLALPDQIIDYTHGRKSSFFEGSDQPVRHVDFTHPYDLDLMKILAEQAKLLKIELKQGGTYGCTQGPRLETAAEIKRMANDGCDVVGMTGMPEAILARELDLRYAAVAVVANHAAGLGDSRNGISLDAMGPILDEAMAQVRRLIAAAVKS
jgi:5'-methylthioinosine phosphorylase